ncbi:MAG: sulfite exporter TauE/SafE family protein [Spirulina sp.]
MLISILLLTGSLGWFVSAIAGGGSSLILIPVVSLLLGTAAVPATITIGALFGNVERATIYWDKIDWKVVRWELSGTLIGACWGAFTLTKIKIEWLSVFLALFLILSAFTYLFRKDGKIFPVRSWYFLPAGLFYSFLSGLIGSMGPILTPFYLSYGLEKEELLATQAMNRAILQVVKAIAYTVFGILTLPYLGYGILLGLAAFPGNWLGHLILERISKKRFRQIVICFVLFSGVLLLYEQQVEAIFK